MYIIRSPNGALKKETYMLRASAQEKKNKKERTK